MSDDRYLIPRPSPPPEPTERKPHPQTFWISVAALVIALLAAAFSGWQGKEARGARIASERSAQAAEDSYKASVAAFEFDQRPVLILRHFRAGKSNGGKHLDFKIMLDSIGKSSVNSVMQDIEVYYDRTKILQTSPAQSDNGVSVGPGPDSHLSFTTAVDLNSEQAKLVAKKSALVSLILKIKYKNDFNKAVPEQGWCLQYDPVQLDHYGICDIPTFEAK
jgi:hypothetical protein